MPIRSLNYTGRRRITREEARIRLRQLSEKIVVFDADIKLDDHKLPEDAIVSVEAYRGSSASWMRFDFGTVGAVKLPDDRRLAEFDGSDGILFRVKVTSPAKGVILAEADGISPRAPDEEEHTNESILPVRSDKNLGKRVWRLHFEDHPVLLVNSALGEKWDVVRDPVFLALVMPQILELILLRIFCIERYDRQDEDTEGWVAQWLKFVRSIPGTADFPDSGDMDTILPWIEDTVSAFSRKLDMLDKFEEYRNRS